VNQRPYLKKSISLDLNKGHRRLTGDETAAQNRRVSGRGDGCGLNNDSDDEDRGVDKNGIFPRDDFGQESTVKGSKPCSQLENRSQPTKLCLISGPNSHIWQVLDDRASARRACISYGA